MVVVWIVGERAEVEARCYTVEVGLPVGEVLWWVADPARSGIL